MKDTEFTELLNLYLDHEISPADAARLESEVQTNPARRRIYHQYCRMQKACKLVAADFQTDADVLLAGQDKKVVAFSPDLVAANAQRKRFSGLQTVGALAAIAACIAITLVVRNRGDAEAATAAPGVQMAMQHSPAAAEASQPSAGTVEASQPRGLVSVAQRPATTLVSNPLLLTGNTQAQAVYAATVRQVDNQLAWLETVQLPPLQQQRTELDKDFVFTAQLGTGGQALGNRAMPIRQKEQTEEQVGFQFVK